MKIKPLDKATFEKFKKRLFHKADTDEMKERAERSQKAEERTTKEILSKMRSVYRDSMAEINKEIEAFYGRYASENGITIADAHKRLDSSQLKSAREEMERFYRFADPERVGKDRSVAFRAKLRELGARKYLSRLEEIKIRMEHILARLAAQEQDVYEKALAFEYKDARDMAYYAIGKDLGFFVEFAAPNEQLILKAIERPWLGENFSDRIWKNKGKLLEALNKEFLSGIARGQNPKKIASTISKKYDFEYKNCERLARTEALHLMQEVTADSYEENGVDKYQFVADLSARTCDLCGGLDGQVFELKYKEEGVNYPVMHPNCVLGDNVVIAPDAECLTRSVYSGDIIKATTTNGRSFSVTPNHIMLTSRGWVRAKNLIKGDKVVYYPAWNKAAVVGNPTDDNGIPTVEELFASLVKSLPMFRRTVPASAEDFKGDVVKDSEIDVVLIYGFLRGKADIPALKFLSDFSLVEASEFGKKLFSGDCSLAQLLVGLGLAADGIMSGSDIAGVLLRGSLTHHQLVGLRLPSDYDTRLIQSAQNNRSADTKTFGKFVDADSVGVKGSNLANRKNLSCIGIADSDSILSKDSANRFFVTLENLSQFFNAFSGLITFDEVTDIQVDKSTVHVYDVSSMSTLYICNGFVSSNCRCSTVPYYDDDLSKLFGNATRIAKDSGGKVIDVPAGMTWTQWKEEYGK